MSNIDTLRMVMQHQVEKPSSKHDERLLRTMGASVAMGAVALATSSFLHLPRSSEYSENLGPCHDPTGEIMTLEESTQAHIGKEPPTFSDLNGEWDVIVLPEGTEMAIKGIGRGAEVLNRDARNVEYVAAGDFEGFRNTSRMWYSIEPVDDTELRDRFETIWSEGEAVYVAGVYTDIDNDSVCLEEDDSRVG